MGRGRNVRAEFVIIYNIKVVQVGLRTQKPNEVGIPAEIAVEASKTETAPV